MSLSTIESPTGGGAPSPHDGPRLSRVRWRTARAAASTLLVIVAAWLAYTLVIEQPTNQRDWAPGFETAATFEISGADVTVQSIRDYRWSEAAVLVEHRQDRTIRLESIVRSWFMYEPFRDRLTGEAAGVAHTYFVFDFADQPPLGVSVEARRERDETYNVLWGLLNQYELMYVWATEEDLTIRRGVDPNAQLYMVPLTIPVDWSRSLLLELARSTAALTEKPRFYNTLTSNCTSELAKVSNRLRPGTIPPSLAWVVPGVSLAELHRLGYVRNDVPLDELKRRYYISDLVREIRDAPDFSARLRQYLDT
ncbi:MAG: DUF4105 domain-containing protein [Chloroflexota bacterium]